MPPKTMTTSISPAAISAVETVAQKFRDNDVTIEEIEGGFAYDSGDADTTVRALAPHNEARLKGAAGVITVETDLPEDAAELTDDELALLNRLAMLSATVRRKDGSLLSACRISVFEGAEEALELQRHLIFGAALIQGEELERAVRFLFEDEKDFDHLPAGDEPGAWNADEFARTARSLYCATTHSAEGMTAELPWDDPAVGKRSSLLRLSVTDHPACGKGLHFTLDLPLQFEGEKLGEICSSLNVHDYEAHDGPPMFGAWCAGATERNPAFIGFIPNLLHRPFIVERLTGWLVQRAEWARQYFERLEGH